MSLGDCYRGWCYLGGEGGSGETRDAGAEIEETDDEANEAQGEITLAGLDKQLQSLGETIRSINSLNEKMKGWIANLPETNDAEEEEQEREWLQKNDEDESESDLLELTGRLGTRMKCFQREVEATDERIVKAKKLSSVSPRSQKRKKRRKKR